MQEKGRVASSASPSASRLNWLCFQLNHSWHAIVAAGDATLADTYKNLTGKKTGWADFMKVINAHFPAGKQYNLGIDPEGFTVRKQ